MAFCRIALHLFFLLWSLVSSSQSYKAVSTIGDYSSGVTVLVKDPGKRFLIAGDKTGNLYFHELKSGAFIKKLKVHGASVNNLQFNSTGKLLISATNDGEIKIYDFRKERIIQAIFSPDYAGIHFVLFSIADGFIYFNGNQRLYKTRSDLTQKIEKVFDEMDTIQDAVMTFDRSALIYVVGNFIKVMNTRTDGISQVINTGGAKIKRISLVKDSLVTTWSDDGALYFWSYKLGQLLPTPDFFLKAGTPSSMSFSENGSLMCSGNIGNWARIWKPMERTIVQELFAHKSTVTGSCFGNTDSHLFTCSLDGKIILWRNDSIPEPEANKQNKEQTEIKTVYADSVVKEKSDVVLNAFNVPEFIYGRNVISNQKIEINTPEIEIFVYDNSSDDGDTMSLFFNNQWILNHYGVTKRKMKINLTLTPNSNNYLVLFANNLGKIPPNTAVIEFQEGNTKRIFKLSSDLKSCSSINFFYKK